MRTMDLSSWTPEQVIAAYWNDGQLPINPKVIAEKLGIEVNSFSKNELKDVSGKFIPAGADDNRRPIIEYNRSESSLRNRFTIAHELGHYFLQHGTQYRNARTLEDGDEQFKIDNSNPIEDAANRFAASLLIPRDYLKAAIFGKGIVDISELANLFGVSPSAIKFRLKDLGIVQHG